RQTRCYRDWSSDVCSSDLDQVPSLLHGYPPRAAREDESKQVYAQPDGDPHPFKLGVPADLDPRHCSTSSRSLAPISGARRSASPTRAASTSSSASALRSALVVMPLSLTTSGPGGIKRRSRRVVSA